MNYRNRLMILSFIALAVFSACTDEVENGGQRPVKGDHRLSFAVSTPGSQTWTKADGTHAASAPATQEEECIISNPYRIQMGTTKILETKILETKRKNRDVVSVCQRNNEIK